MTSLPVISLVVAMFIWGSSFIALKLAFQGYHPMVVIFGRMLIASLAFIPIIPRFRKIRIRRHDIPLLLFMAFCEPCLYFLLEAMALINTSATQASVITTTLPLLITVASIIFLAERISRKVVLGLLIAMTGSLVLSIGSSVSEQAPNPLLGNFYEFLAMLCAAGYTICIRKLTYRYPPLFLTAVQAWIGCLFFAPIVALPSVPLPDSFLLTPVLAIIYMGIVVTIAAFGLYNYALSKMEAARAAIFINLIPIFTLILSRLTLGEKFTLLQLFASMLIFFGVGLTQDSFGKFKEWFKGSLLTKG